MLLLAAEYTASQPPLQSSQAQLPLLLAGIVTGVGQEIAVDIAVETDTALDAQASLTLPSGSTQIPLLLTMGSSTGVNSISVEIAIETDTAFNASVIDNPAVDYDDVVALAIETDSVFEAFGTGLLAVQGTYYLLNLTEEDEDTLVLTQQSADSLTLTASSEDTSQTLTATSEDSSLTLTVVSEEQG